jgi:hypothetical protein
MKYSEIKRDDPRWSDSDKLVFEHLFRLVGKYEVNKRPLEAYGVKRSIFTMAMVLTALKDLDNQDTEQVDT